MFRANFSGSCSGELDICHLATCWKDQASSRLACGVPQHSPESGRRPKAPFCATPDEMTTADTVEGIAAATNR
jgi:hypothetical protein